MKKILILTVSIVLSYATFSQNVGISNDATFTTPQSPLHIYWTSDGNLLQLSRSFAINTGLMFSVSGNNFSINNRQAGMLSFYTNNTERLRIPNANQILAVPDGTVAAPAWSFVNNTTMGIYRSAANQLSFSTNSTERMRILSTGPVQIGYGTAATDALQVSGYGVTNPTVFIGSAGVSAPGHGSIRMYGNTYGTNTIHIRGGDITYFNTGYPYLFGTNTVVYAGDICDFVASATDPFAVNAYTSGDGEAFYGEISTGNTTNFSVMELAHLGSGNGACILANNNSTNNTATGGTGIKAYSSSTVHDGSDYYTSNYAGIYGIGAYGTSRYSYGVVGVMDGTGRRSGGVMGTYFITDWGSNGTAYGLCYVGGATTTAKSYINNIHYEVGMGGWGDLMGGHIKGNVYGLFVKGNRYSLYVDGKQYNNKNIKILNKVNDKIIPTNTTNSIHNDIIDRGNINVSNGTNFIAFSKDFIDLVDSNTLTINITPVGKKIDYYIERITNKGFFVHISSNQLIENDVKIMWLAIGNNKFLDDNNPNEILDINFNDNMNQFLNSELSNDRIPMWWDGQQLRFEPIPN